MRIDLGELKKLHDVGFALHWLRVRSKVPLHGGWTKGPRLTWEEFKRTFSKDLNVGVRLGSASKVEGHFLAVIDVDVKSELKAHAEAALKRVYELFPEAKESPVVHSGRGNGSMHLYVLLKEPVSGADRKSQSVEIVKVKMPSVDPSKKEKAELTEQELKAGIRLRPAWEVSLLSEGRQVALPPSIHPDSGREYAWASEMPTEGWEFPVLPQPRAGNSALKAFVAERPNPPNLTSRKFEDVNLDALGLRSDQVDMIQSGDGVSDRSAACFSICMALIKRGVSDNTIVSLLTDKNFFLGQTAFDHSKTNNRDRAAYWIEKYCLRKAHEQVRASAFDHEVEEVVEGDTAKPPKLKRGTAPVEVLTARGLDSAVNWHKELDWKNNNGGVPTLAPTYKNAKTILQNAVSFALLRRDVFALKEFFGADTPWGKKKGDERSGSNADELQVKTWLLKEYNVEMSLNTLKEAMDAICGENEFHPVKDYLASIEWDGVERVEKAFKKYLGAVMPEPYLSDVSRKFFIAMMARIFQPGCKFDHIVVLEGAQGIGKSSFGRILVGDKWFLDSLPSLEDKDAALALHGNWLIEMSELTSIYRAKNESVKAFVSRQVDKFRPPYGYRTAEFPRKSVFYGTTNDANYLTDSTGNRRYWPVLVRQCDFGALIRDREQLLAEAHYLYETEREKLYLEGKAKEQAVEIQESRRIEDEGDSMEAILKKHFDTPPGEQVNTFDFSKPFQLDELFGDGPFGVFQRSMANRKMAAKVLRELKFNKRHTKHGNLWVRKGEP